MADETERTVKPIWGLSGECEVPGSPDHSLMALALAAKAGGRSEIRRCSRRSEVEALLQAMDRLGLKVERDREGVQVTGGALREPEGALDAGESALLFACLAGMLAGAPFATRIEGDRSCADRAGSVMEALQALGARFSLPEEGVFPLEVGGSALKAGRFQIESPNAAVKCAMFLGGLGVRGEVELLQESGGDDDLEILLKAVGVELEKGKVEGGEGYRLLMGGPAEVQPVLHDLPGDPDAAFYLLFTAAMLPQSDLMLTCVGNDWKTRRLLELLRWMNVQLSIQVTRSASKFPIRTVHVVGSELRRTRIAGAQAALFLNELPFLAVVGACASGETLIRDAQALREGETDCLALVVENLRRMEVPVGELPDGLVVKGGHRLQGAEVDAGGDARVGMAFALAGLVAEGVTTVVNPGPIERDFSGVFRCLSAVAQQKG